MSYDEFKALQEKIDAISRDEPLPQVNEDSNHKIIMGFIDQWIEAGQPKDYMADLVAYVKKTIPDSKNWNYAASLINDGVKSYQDREYGTSSLMGLRGKTESQVNEDSIDQDKFDQLNNIFMSLESLKADVGELQDLDNTEGATGSGDLHDQIATMDKLIEQFYQVIDRATSVVPQS